MIDFRYHVVSIVAVFLSLAIGLVLGANALQAPVLHGLNATNKDLHNSNQVLRGQKETLNSQATGEDQLVAALGQQLLPNRLKNQSVVFVQAPGGSESIYEQLSKEVQAAGARVQGKVTIQALYLQQDQQSFLDKLAGQLAPSMTFHDGANTYDRAGAVLASALVTKGQSGSQDTSGILSGFAAANLITTSAPTLPRATLAIVIPPSVPSKTTATSDDKALVALAGALADADQATVLAGPPTAAQDGGAIAALRDSDTFSAKVSSVDTLDTPTTSAGLVVSVLALENQLSTGKAGAYGLGHGAGAFMPDPLPTPASASPAAPTPTKGT